MQTYIAGESFAGQSIPYIADAIIRTTLISTKLSGLIMGNAWISPREQYPAYLDYLLEGKLIKSGSKAAKAVAAAIDKCQIEMNRLDALSDGSGKGKKIHFSLLKSSTRADFLFLPGLILIPICEEMWVPIVEGTKDKECVNLIHNYRASILIILSPSR